ncbi:MAG: ferric reductase-like transmembrane domain-containing protein [Micromonosporaceae bacterium]
MSGITQSTALWYASRATGVVSMVLLSIVVILGVLVNRQGRLPGLPRFAVTGLHRSISLISVVFIAVHVLTAVADKYVNIRLAAAIIPFTSSYMPLQIGLGAVALDLGIAVIVTSLIRARISRRLWRAVHWLAYAAYPVALFHGLTSATDLRSGGLLAVTAACVLGAAAAVYYRLVSMSRAREERIRSGERAAYRSKTAAATYSPKAPPARPGQQSPRDKEGVFR